MHLSSVLIQWMMFIRILMITIQEGEKVLIVFYDMIADVMANKKVQAIINELFISCRKLIFHLFISHSLVFLFQKMSD